jgi:hypothetical protein
LVKDFGVDAEGNPIKGTDIPKLYYKIASNFKEAANNNTIECEIVRDEKSFYTSKEFSFGT